MGPMYTSHRVTVSKGRRSREFLSQLQNLKFQISNHRPPSLWLPFQPPAMSKKRLFTPGPVEVPQAALLAMARQVRHHRTPEFRSTMSEVQEGLKYAFQTANDVLILSSSGTGGMEAAVVNLVPRARKGPGAGVGQVRRAVAADRRAVRHRGRTLRTALGRGLRSGRSRAVAQTTSGRRGRLLDLAGNEHRRGP